MRIPYPQQIAEACCQLLLGTPPSTVVKVPTTTISATTAGDHHIVVASAANFLPESVLTFWDGLGEPLVSIDSVAGTTLTLHTPLQVSHSNGTVVATNIVPFPLVDNSPALANGFAMWGIYVLDDVSAPANAGEYLSRGLLTIAYQLSALQTDSAKVDSQVWQAGQMTRGEQDIDDVMAMLEKNFRLIVNATPNCQQLLSFHRSRRHNMMNPARPTFDFFLEVAFQGRREAAR